MELKNVVTPVFPETKEDYEAPVIETVEVRVERGFQESPGGLSRNPNNNERPTYS